MATPTLRQPFGSPAEADTGRRRGLGAGSCWRLLWLALPVPLLVVAGRARRSRQGIAHRTGPAVAGNGKEVN